MTPFAHGLLGALPAWRFDRRLPLWAFLPRGARVERMQALRCASCQVHVSCRRRIAAGAFSPPRACPNVQLLR
jgi:hypothetical protein